MPQQNRLKLALLLASVLLLAACDGSAPRADSPAQAPAGSPSGQSASGGGSKVNIDKIFPPGPGRDTVLNTCQNCHSFVPIVILQMDRDAWQRNSLDHRERVANLTDEEFRTLYDYLSANFGPHRPVPELPKELLESWTSY